jgi:hypothetical protein
VSQRDSKILTSEERLNLLKKAIDEDRESKRQECLAMQSPKPVNITRYTRAVHRVEEQRMLMLSRFVTANSGNKLQLSSIQDLELANIGEITYHER